jgi:hypothetical protein
MHRVAIVLSVSNARGAITLTVLRAIVSSLVMVARQASVIIARRSTLFVMSARRCCVTNVIMNRMKFIIARGAMMDHSVVIAIY